MGSTPPIFVLHLKRFSSEYSNFEYTPSEHAADREILPDSRNSIKMEEKTVTTVEKKLPFRGRKRTQEQPAGKGFGASTRTILSAQERSHRPQPRPRRGTITIPREHAQPQ